MLIIQTISGNLRRGRNCQGTNCQINEQIFQKIPYFSIQVSTFVLYLHTYFCQLEIMGYDAVCTVE